MSVLRQQVRSKGGNVQDREGNAQKSSCMTLLGLLGGMTARFVDIGDTRSGARGRSGE